MRQSIKMMCAAAVTGVVVAASLLVPRAMMERADQKVNGIVEKADKVYYTGTLDAYNGENDFYMRLMLITGKWESRQEAMYAEGYDLVSVRDEGAESGEGFIDYAKELIEKGITNLDALDYISRLSLRYWPEEGEQDIPGFMAQGNAVRTVCNLSEFELMPRIFSLYYESWGFSSPTVYRYTDLLFKKYRCDAAMMNYLCDYWNAGANLLIDVETGDFIGMRVWYDPDLARGWVEETKLVRENGISEEEEGNLAFPADWDVLFLDGEKKVLNDGTTISVPLSQERAEKQRLDENVTVFLDRIDYTLESCVTSEEEMAQIAPVPNISDDTINSYGPYLGFDIEEGRGIRYAYIVTENSSKKKFYFVISSGTGNFEVYFSPMTEKNAGNSLTEE